ncbi:hypothetical protein PL11_007470 [Lentilactobacillus curieae]|uniref:IrrE N-terminal-like domain-containing protein n=1 Tax=Lentilactobacillus curieae TaxID=1138822 RepID=A0A1S6QJH6_9LACO|nr:ImmA/IrrE family metallo-endopeptidase [Lentilactobacillus curieae]AQW21762.1 hypothetical protein PL11_007470 [Lentilactobacillus curieae]
MDELINYLCNYAYKHHIGFILSSDRMRSDYVPTSSYLMKLVIINMNWDPKTQIPFQFAHEMGHIINGDSDVVTVSTTTIREENSADKFAIDLLIEYAKLNEIPTYNAVKFTELFGIPTRLEGLVGNELKALYGSDE